MVFKRIPILIMLFLFVFLASCEKEQTMNNTDSLTDTTTGNGSILDFRITWKGYSGRGEAIQTIVDIYNKNHSDGSTITMINGDEDRNNIEALLKSDSDTIYVLPYRYVKYFGDKGYLKDLTEDFKDEEELYYPEIWKLGTVEGKSYGIPWLGHSMCLLYNKNLLEEAGVDADSIDSLDALAKAIELIEEKTDAQGIGLVGANGNDVSWMVNQFIYGFGSDLVSDDGTNVTINTDKSKAALEMYKNILGKHAQPTWIDDTAMEVMTYFRNQEVAFEILGIWGVTDIEKNGSPFEVGIISLNDIGLSAEVGPMMLAIPSAMSDENKEESVQFINYLISKEAQEQIMKGEYSPEHDAYYPFRTPIRIDMADSQIFQSHPEYMTFIEGFQNPSIDMPVPAWQKVKDEIYGEGLHKVMNDEMTIEEFLDMIETKGNQILSTNK
jgi:multiple sugar transport system substrate-binding protein